MKPAYVLSAAQLKKRFGVYGFFYGFRHQGVDYPCRALLELIAHEHTPRDINALPTCDPELLVVMMNPGSSRPLEAEYRPRSVAIAGEIADRCELVPTRPDNTQYQVMRLMVAWGLRHARVLNLSDLRQPKSPLVARTIHDLSRCSGGDFHTLFSPSRRRELDGLAGTPGAAPLLAGWGRHEPFRPLAENCLQRLAAWRIVGVPVDTPAVFYAHPSPMLQRHKDLWLETVRDQWRRKGESDGGS